MSLITEPTMSFIVPVTFCALLGIGFFMGLWNGVATATYFSIWNLVFLIVGIFTYKLIFNGIVVDQVESLLDGMLGDSDDTASSIDIKKIFPIFEEIFGLLNIFVFLIVANFLAFIVYWFFRRWLKETIKDNKSFPSNYGRRFGGAAVGSLIALPFASIASQFTAVLSPMNGFIKVNNGLVAALTLGQITSTGERIEDMREAVALVENIDEITDAITPIIDVIGNADPSDDNWKEAFLDQKDALEKIFNNGTILEIATDLLQSQINNNDDFDPSSLDPEAAKKIDIGLEENSKIAITDANRQKIIDALVNAQKDTPNVVTDELKEYYDIIFDKFFTKK